MNNRSFQKAINFVFTLILAFGLLLPASSTLALPQKAAPMAVGVSTPNDILYSSQWNLFDTWGINAPAAWTITNGSSVVVAVIDTGITVHEDLDGVRILDGYDFITNTTAAGDGGGRDDNPRDEGDWCVSTGADSTWQGTHVAGIIGARSNNSTGVAGINWVANILPVRVSGKCGIVSVTDLMDGMNWAAGITTGLPANPNPAKVLNVGVGVPGEACTTHQTAINNILATGAVIVAAAGDNGAETSNFPANCTGVISVAATDVDGNRASISNYGSTVKISAPGENVLSTTNSGDQNPVSDGGNYTTKTDTGIAAAHVSGVVSLMLSMNPGMTPSQILQTLQKTAKAFPGGSTCTTSICGSGIVDAGAALKPDLVITNVFLTPRTSGLCPDNTVQPPTPYSPPTTVDFCVYITVKNQGGSNTGSAVYRNVYFTDPSTLEMTPNGGLLTSDPLDDPEDLDTGIYAQDNNPSMPPGVTRTLPVPIPGFSAAGVYNVYGYTDAQGNVAEVFENNNNFAPVTISVGASSTGGDKIGVFRPSTATFYLRNTNSVGAPDITAHFGAPGDYPVVGDWDGNGTDTIGVYRNGVFYLSNSNTSPSVALTFAFGKAGDQPIAGDWNGDGKDTIGIYRSSTITFLLRNTNSAGAADANFRLGSAGDVGIAGDWNNDGKDTTGVFRPSNGALYLKNTNTSGYADVRINYGTTGDKPVTGDWNNDGVATIGVYRSAMFWLRNTNTKGFADIKIAFGATTDMPLAGNWNGTP